jgi:ankyrin repeat protein
MCLPVCANADYKSFEEQAIAIVKATPVSSIESGKSERSFGEWFSNLAGKSAKLSWELNDCGEGTGGPADQERDMPLCVGATAELPDGRWISAAIGVANASDMKRMHLPRGPGLRDVFAGYKEQTLHYGNSLTQLEEFLSAGTRNIGLLQSALKGDALNVQALLRQGADPNFGFEKTPLMEAATSGQKTVIPLLLDAGANINARTKYGETALSLAAQGGHLEVVRLLLSKGADANSRSEALRSVAMSGYLEIARVLLKAGADVNYGDSQIRTTPLMWASKGNNVEMIRVLMEAGADVNAVSEFGTALKMSAGEGTVDGLRFLLAHGADVRPKNAESPLISAASSGSLEKARILLEHGADINATANGWGGTSLMWAAQSGHLELVKMLIQKGADLEQRSTKDGFTALSLAMKNNQQQVVSALRKAGAKE